MAHHRPASSRPSVQFSAHSRMERLHVALNTRYLALRKDFGIKPDGGRIGTTCYLLVTTELALKAWGQELYPISPQAL